MQTNLSPEAIPNYHKRPTIFMGPAPGICHSFQFGTCSLKDHHRNQDGSLQLHVCQPCLQIRGFPVDHHCVGHHNGHVGGKKLVGALGCSHQLSPPSSISSPPPNIQPTSVQSNQMNITNVLLHLQSVPPVDVVICVITRGT